MFKHLNKLLSIGLIFFLSSCSINPSNGYKISYRDEEKINKIFDTSKYDAELSDETMERLINNRLYSSTDDILINIDTFKCYKEAGDINNEVFYYNYNFEFDKNQNYMNKEEFFIYNVFNVFGTFLEIDAYGVYFSLDRVIDLGNNNLYRLRLYKIFGLYSFEDDDSKILVLEQSKSENTIDEFPLSSLSFNFRDQLKIHTSYIDEALIESTFEDWPLNNFKYSLKDETYYVDNGDHFIEPYIMKTIYDKNLLNLYYYETSSHFDFSPIGDVDVDCTEMSTRMYNSNDIKTLSKDYKDTNLAFDVGNVMEGFNRDILYEELESDFSYPFLPI